MRSFKNSPQFCAANSTKYCNVIPRSPENIPLHTRRRQKCEALENSLEIYFCVTFHLSHWRHFEWFPFPFQKDVHYDVQPYFSASSSFHFKHWKTHLHYTQRAYFLLFTMNNEMSLWKQSFVLMHSFLYDTSMEEGGIIFSCDAIFSLSSSFSYESGLIAKKSSSWFFNSSTASSDIR